MTENNGLPPGWALSTIGEICNTTSGGTPSRKVPSYYGGDIPWLKSGELNDSLIYEIEEFITEEGLQNSSAKIFPQGTLLIALYGATVGRLGILGVAAATNQAVCALFPPEELYKKFLFWFLRKQRDDLLKARIGGAQPNISQTILRAVEIPIPPLTEQERIVAKIEELFTQLEAGVAELQQAKAQLQRYRQAVLKSAVEGELTREWRKARGKGGSETRPDENGEQLLARILSERRAKWEAEGGKGKYKDPASPDTDGLPELPEGWVWASVGQVAEHRLGKMLDKAKNVGIPTPYLRNINVRWFEFDFSDIQHMRVTDDEIDNVSVRAGDLVVCEGGEPGRASVWEKEGEPFVIQKALHRVRAADGVLPWFLAYHLAADAWTGRLKGYFTGSTIMHFTGQSLHSYIFALSPTEEQELIIQKVERRLSVADEIEKELDQALARSERLRQSILKRAFEGKLVD